MIRLRDVRWTYGGTDAAVLHSLNLHVRQGETVVLGGPSGSGKSTALRLMNGLVPHFHDGRLKGEVHVGGMPITELPLDRIGRMTGTVLQHPRRQFFTENIDTELAFALENFGEPPRSIRDRVAAVIDEFDLAGLTDQRLFDLSGGQQQRVACAAAIAHRPPLLLFDEPTSNLSASAINDFAAILRRLRARGVMMVIAEHRLQYLRGLADRIVVLRDGRAATEWAGAEFDRLDDATLRAEGLRGLEDPQPHTLRCMALPGNGPPRTCSPHRRIRTASRGSSARPLAWPAGRLCEDNASTAGSVSDELRECRGRKGTASPTNPRQRSGRITDKLSRSNRGRLGCRGWISDDSR